MATVIAALPINSSRGLEMLFSSDSIVELKLSCAAVVVVAHGDGAAMELKIAAACAKVGLPLIFKKVPDAMRAYMSALRQETLNCVAEHFVADAVLLLDDDIILRKGYSTSIKKAMDYLDSEPQCGLVLLASAFGGGPFGDRVVPFRGTHCSMGNGLLVRNLNTSLFGDAVHCLGGAEELLLAAKINSLGFWVAKKFNVAATHKHFGTKQLNKGDQSQIHNLEIALAGNIAVAAKLLGVEKAFNCKSINRQFQFPPDPFASAFVALHWKNKSRSKFKVLRDGVEFSSATAALKDLAFSPQAKNSFRLKLREQGRIEIDGHIFERVV